jgi:hypothetical protein
LIQTRRDHVPDEQTEQARDDDRHKENTEEYPFACIRILVGFLEIASPVKPFVAKLSILNVNDACLFHFFLAQSP